MFLLEVLLREYRSMLELSNGIVSEKREASKHEVPRPNFITLGVLLYRNVV